MKRLPAISSDLRIRLEGAIEQVESVVVQHEARVLERRPDGLPALARKWPETLEAAKKLEKHAELAELSAAFETSRVQLEALARSECELLGIAASESFVTNLEAIARASRAVPVEWSQIVVQQTNAFLIGAAVLGVASSIAIHAFVKLGIVAFFVGSSVAGGLAWLGMRRAWKITAREVVVPLPRATAMAIADITNVELAANGVFVKAGEQVLFLSSGTPQRVGLVIDLLRRGVQTSDSVHACQTRRLGVATFDEHGLMLLPVEHPHLPQGLLGRFEPRALALALDAQWWSAAELNVSVTEHGLRVALPDGDELTAQVSDPSRFLRRPPSPAQ
ncbi:MAG: hypothetical protein QM817_25235 [Archangium sp.]